jgi:hypothetical protein
MIWVLIHMWRAKKATPGAVKPAVDATGDFTRHG